MWSHVASGGVRVYHEVGGTSTMLAVVVVVLVLVLYGPLDAGATLAKPYPTEETFAKNIY